MFHSLHQLSLEGSDGLSVARLQRSKLVDLEVGVEWVFLSFYYLLESSGQLNNFSSIHRMIKILGLTIILNTVFWMSTSSENGFQIPQNWNRIGPIELILKFGSVILKAHAVYPDLSKPDESGEIYWTFSLSWLARVFIHQYGMGFRPILLQEFYRNFACVLLLRVCNFARFDNQSSSSFPRSFHRNHLYNLRFGPWKNDCSND